MLEWLRTPGQARDYNTVRFFPPYSYSVSLPKYRLPLSHCTFCVVRNVLHVALELGILQLQPQEREMSVPILASEEGTPRLPHSFWGSGVLWELAALRDSWSGLGGEGILTRRRRCWFLGKRRSLLVPRRWGVCLWCSCAFLNIRPWIWTSSFKSLGRLNLDII